MLIILLICKNHSQVSIKTCCSPLLNKELHQILYGYKKGADRCIYHSEALQCLYKINANDPRPQRAVALGHTTKDRLKSRYSKLKHTAKTECLRERSPCPLVREICRFQSENKSKNSISLKR